MVNVLVIVAFSKKALQLIGFDV